MSDFKRIDGIEVQIKSDASNANAELDKMIMKLMQLKSSINSVNGSGLGNMASGINTLANSVKSFSTVKTTDINKVVRSIEKLNNINTSNLINASVSINKINSSLSTISTVSSKVEGVQSVATSVGTLGSAKVKKATEYLPNLSKALLQMFTELSKAPSVKKDVIDLTNALANLASQGSKVKSAAGALNDSFKTQNISNYTNRLKTMSINTFSLASAIGKFYATYFLVLRAIQGTTSAVQKSMDYIETFNYFSVITDKISTEFGGAWEQNGYLDAETYVESFTTRLTDLMTQMTGYELSDNGMLNATSQLGLGLDPTEIMNFQASILSITNSVGMLGDASVDVSKALSMIAVDFSSLKNIDLETTMANLTSGLVGQSEALYKYGIDITNITLEQIALNNGISKSVAEMTQAEKMYLRVIQILDSSRVAWGDMSKTVNSVANQSRVLQQQLSNLARTFGNLFIPVLQEVLPYINAFVISLQRLFSWLGIIIYGTETWGSMMEGVTSGFSDSGLDSLGGSIEDVTTDLEDANTSAEKLTKTLLGYQKLNVISTQEDTGSADSVIGGGTIDDQLSGALGGLLDEYETVWNAELEKMDNKMSEIADNISSYFKKIKDTWNSTGNFTWLGEDIADAVNYAIEGLGNFVKEFDAIKIGKSVGTFLNGFFTNVDYGELANTAVDLIDKAVEFLVEASENADFSEISSAIVDGILDIDYLQLANSLLKALFGFSDIFKEIGRGIGTAIADEILLAVGAPENIVNADLSLEPKTSFDMPNMQYGELTDIDLSGLEDSWINFSTWWDTVIIKPMDNSFKSTMESITQWSSNTARDFENIWIGISSWWDVNVSQPVSSAFESTMNSIGYWASDTKRDFEVIWSNTSTWFDTTVAKPLGSKFESAMSSIKEWALNTEISFETIWGGVSTWWNTNITSPISSASETLGKEIDKFMTDPAGYIESAWENLNTWFNTSVVSPISSLFEGLGTTVSNIFEGILSTAKTAINGVIDFINNLHIEIPKVEILGQEIFPGFRLDFPDIPKFATGGFPEDGLFMANSTELVGKFSNGKTAVANNDQIISGIKYGVKDANKEVVATLLSVANELIKAIKSSQHISIDGNVLFDVVRENADIYEKQYGEPAF